MCLNMVTECDLKALLNDTYFEIFHQVHRFCMAHEL